MTGIDPDGIDLRGSIDRGGETARLDFPVDFPAPVLDPAAARQALIALTRQARGQSRETPRETPTR
jgi:putative heme iron utilization protein